MNDKRQVSQNDLEMINIGDAVDRFRSDKSSDFENSPLTKPEKRGSKRSLLGSGWSSWFSEKGPEENRKVYLYGYASNMHRRSKNIVKNQKYNVFTFIPVVIFNQFKFFFNLFYLLIALSQFVPALKVGFLFTYIGPLALVLVLTMVKEGYDDFQRYKRDTEANSSLYTVLKANKVKIQKPSSKLEVGDIIEVHPHQRIPADLLLLYSSEENGTIFIKTDQLDGETDWKLRRAPRFAQRFFSDDGNLANLSAHITYPPPSENIYHFEGVLEADSAADKVQESLFLDHTLWANTSITSGKVYGIVIYTGRDTRISMNSRKPRSKIGKIDLELNTITKFLFAFMLLIALVIVSLNGFYAKWYLQYFRYMLLMASIIPISLRVNLDFSKAIFSYKINHDPLIPDTKARNSDIPEELGRISFLLTDKTGTLTKNDMHFKRLVLEHAQYEEENIGMIIKTVKTQCERFNGPMADVEAKYLEHPQSQAITGFDQLARPKRIRRDKENILRDLVTSLAVCHNVTPIMEDGKQIFHASSPDEIALVNFGMDIKMKLLERNNDYMVVENPNGQNETFEILANFPFSSESKRMGILVRHKETGRLIFFLKGADVAICPRVKEVHRSLLLDECESLARTGLRTMVFAQRYITAEEYEGWKKIWDEAHLSMANREEKMRKAAELLETDMDFLGITGVEDKLQDDINVTLESLRNAGIKIWMLTGDKVETAKCISISTGLKTVSQEMFEIKEVKGDLELVNKINDFSNRMNTVLLIDGTSLTKALENHQKIFFEAAVRAPAVVCARCLPTQKAIITEMVKKFSKKRVACVGDGGNDVGMIQSADVGIGIVGKEGKQAALASDFSIMEFQYLKHLILWHGRLYYKNSAKLSQFVIHRGLIISFIQAIFIAMFYFVAIPIYNGMLMLGYTTLYTTFPVFSLIFDEDIDRDKALNYPLLYKTLQKSRELNVKTFLVWLWKSLFQAAVIMIMGVYVFEDSFLTIVTITFTALILSEILNVYTELNKLHPVMIASLIGTVILYFLSIILFRNYISVEAINGKFMVNIILIVSVSWAPLHIIKAVLNCYDPSDYQKVMQRL